MDLNAPFQKPSETSRAAAESVENAGSIRESIYRYLLDHGLSTDEWIQKALKLNPSTERPRRIELVERGLVYDSGLRGRTKSGREAVLWNAIPQTANLNLFADLPLSRQQQIAKRLAKIDKLQKEVAALRAQDETCATTIS